MQQLLRTMGWKGRGRKETGSADALGPFSMSQESLI